jgi:hypothetical protein
MMIIAMMMAIVLCVPIALSVIIGAFSIISLRDRPQR